MSATSVNNRMSHTASFATNAAGEDSFATSKVPRDDADLVVLPGGRPKGSTLKSNKMPRNLNDWQPLRLLESTNKHLISDKSSSCCLMSGKLKYYYSKCNGNKASTRFATASLSVHPPFKVVQEEQSQSSHATRNSIANVILQLARMCCPRINPTTRLHLANSLIEGTELAKVIVAISRKAQPQ